MRTAVIIQITMANISVANRHVFYSWKSIPFTENIENQLMTLCMNTHMSQFSVDMSLMWLPLEKIN